MKTMTAVKNLVAVIALIEKLNFLFVLRKDSRIG